MRVYLLIMLIAAAVTYLTTPAARWLALRTGAITAVRARDVHATPTPRLGGVAILAGIAVAMVLAAQMPFLEGVFSGRQPWAVLGGAALVCLLGALDDIWDLDWMTKLVGQVLAAWLMAWWGGIWLFQLPIAGRTVYSSQTSLVATILVIVVAINAVNFVDGLDGLAAGVIAIGGAGFFGYTYLLTQEANPQDYSNIATVVVACLVGACLGFLPHNFHPARIFMGDSGSMVIGLTIAAAGIVVTGQIDPDTVSERQQAIPAFLPILLPVAVLVLPLLDMGLAVIRRMAAGRSPFHPDRRHLHHRLLQLGHSHRRAVVIMYLWTALVALGAAALARWSLTTVLWAMVGGVVVLGLLTLGPLRGAARSTNAVAGPPAPTAAAADAADSSTSARSGGA